MCVYESCKVNTKEAIHQIISRVLAGFTNIYYFCSVKDARNHTTATAPAMVQEHICAGAIVLQQQLAEVGVTAANTDCIRCLLSRVEQHLLLQRHL